MAKLYVPKNVLKEKVGDGGFSEKDIQQAQEFIQETEIDFNPIALRYLKELKNTLSKYHGDPSGSSNLRDMLLDSLMQLRAQGAMFGYESVTILTDVVVDLLDNLKKVDAKVVEIIEAYEKALSLLLGQGITKADDKVCVAMKTEMALTCKKYLDKNS